MGVKPDADRGRRRDDKGGPIIVNQEAKSPDLYDRIDVASYDFNGGCTLALPPMFDDRNASFAIGDNAASTSRTELAFVTTSELQSLLAPTQFRTVAGVTPLDGSMLRPNMEGISDYIQDLADMDYRRNGPDPVSGKVRSFIDVYRQLMHRKVIGICGGARLESESHPAEHIYGELNRFLGRELAKCEWSVCSGGGPGKAMKGLQFCMVKSYRPKDAALSISVLSGLNDEAPHKYADLLVRSPGDIAIREKMIIGLSSAVIIYPGNIGTIAEIAELMMQNYVHGRGPYSTNPPMFVLVSYEDPELVGGHYFAPILDQLKNAKIAGLTKGEDYNWMKVVTLPNPKLVANMDPEEGDDTFRAKAAEIRELVEAGWKRRRQSFDIAAAQR